MHESKQRGQKPPGSLLSHFLQPGTHQGDSLVWAESGTSWLHWARPAEVGRGRHSPAPLSHCVCHCPAFLTFPESGGVGVAPLPSAGARLRPRPTLSPTLGGCLQGPEWEAPSRGHRLDLPATQGAFGRVSEDPQGTGAAEVCVAAGHKAGVGSLVEADGTILSCCGWERGQHRSGTFAGKG